MLRTISVTILESEYISSTNHSIFRFNLYDESRQISDTLTCTDGDENAQNDLGTMNDDQAKSQAEKKYRH